MRRLKLFHNGRRDGGAVTAIVAVVLGGGVVLGMAAIVVDIGRLYAEREQLQTGADAAAMAVAEQCAREPDSCGEQQELAERYAGANAADGVTAVPVVCGRAVGLAECPPPAQNRTVCLGTPPADGPYAEIRTRTRLPDGSTVLPPTFAAAMAGPEYSGTEVGACARAAWGPPRRANGFAVTFSICEWSEMTAAGTEFWPVPAAGNPPAAAERVVYLKDGGDASTCPAGPSGWDRPGGFGWLDDDSGTCKVTVEVDGSYGGNTGNSPSQPCRQALESARQNRAVSLFPIYDGVRGTGANTTYHLAGFASFVLTGYRLSGAEEASWLTGRHQCGGAQRCLYGYFVRGLVPTTGGDIGGPDLGVSIVNLVG